MKSLYKAKSGYYRECKVLSNNGNTAKIQFRFAKNTIIVESQRIVKFNKQLKDKSHQITKQFEHLTIQQPSSSNRNKEKPTTNFPTSKNHPRPTTRKRSRNTAFAETEKNRKYPFREGEPITKRRRKMDMDPNAQQQQQQNDQDEQVMTIEDVLKKYKLSKQDIKTANKMTLIGLRATLNPKERELMVNTNGLLKVSQLQIWVGLETEEIAKAQEQAEKDKMEVAGMNERLDRVTKELERERARKENKEDTVK